MTEEEFKRRMAELAVDDPAINMAQLDNLIATRSPWEINQIALHLHAKNERPRHFLRWSTIQKTMFVGNAPYVNKEWNSLMKARPTRWRGQLNAPQFGRPIMSDIEDEYNPQLCGNTIHQAFMLHQFEQKANLQIDQLDSIFEFGGGYGALCYLIHELGFMGEYQIYDLPEMLLLQQYYLGNTIDGEVDISYVNKVKKMKIDLFVANISISETPIDLRNKCFALIDAKHYFISYLPTHNKVQNKKYFIEHCEKTQDKITWTTWYNLHKTNIIYLYGKKL